MTIRSKPPTKAYRDGWDRVFGKGSVSTPKDPPKALGVGKSSRGIGSTHEVVKQIIDKLQTETCAPCNEEHPRGEVCSGCGRKLLLG